MKEKKFYLVWNTEDDDSNYWEHYDSVTDAVSSSCKNDHGAVEVYEATPKRLGLFKQSYKTVKVKEKKTK